MNSRQRAYLKSLAMVMDPILQIGKSSLTPEITEAVNEALEARELVKIHVLKNCMDDARSIGEALAGRTHSQVVQVIGKKIVLYRESKTKKKIMLPQYGSWSRKPEGQAEYGLESTIGRYKDKDRDHGRDL